MSKFYDLKATNNKGEEVSMADFKGQPVLIVNTASACGFTPQFEGLEKLFKDYSDKGLKVLGFPCNQFGSQDKGTDDEIQTFCKMNYGVSFPIMKKSDVNGDNTNEVFKWLKSQKSQLGMERIKWNFEKFLVDGEGNVYARYSSLTKPATIAADVEKLLNSGSSS